MLLKLILKFWKQTISILIQFLNVWWHLIGMANTNKLLPGIYVINSVDPVWILVKWNPE